MGVAVGAVVGVGVAVGAVVGEGVAVGADVGVGVAVGGAVVGVCFAISGSVGSSFGLISAGNDGATRPRGDPETISNVVPLLQLL